MTKYHAVRAIYAGEEYDSTGEADYAQQLDARKVAGQIRDWRRGREWILLESPTGRPRDGITLTPDFEVWDATGHFRVVDFKALAHIPCTRLPWS
jgi:Protein of unknown function (DUF1064)